MVREVEKDGQTLYVCEICDVTYAEGEWVRKCQAWDEQHPGSCNLEIIQHAVTQK